MSSIAESMLSDHADEKRIYTQEENYRAYKLFSMMDVDNGGSITLRELYRVLMGDAIRYVSCDFSHPDSGIVWGLDEEACVAIMDIEEGSLALNFPFLILRMRIHSINGQIIPQHDPKSLELVYELMLRLHEDPMTLEFIEPIIVVNKFSCVLDMEIENILVSIQLPVGAVYNLNVFKRNLSKEMVRAHPGLRFVKVDFFERKRQIYFKSRRYNFRLLFLTGPNNRRSCRYALGFNAEDTPYGNYHVGQPMLIDLNLGLDREKTEILMVELFNKFDRDGSGEFEFEEFRDFYIRYLDSDESLHFLREYAKHRFRDIEHEKRVRKEQLERENRARRRAYLKIKYHDLVEAQKAKFRNDSIVDVYGNRRRLYHHRTKNPSKGNSTITEESTTKQSKRSKNITTTIDTITSDSSLVKHTINNNNTPLEAYNADNIHSIDEESFIEKGLNESGNWESQSDKSSQSSVFLSNVVMKRRTVLAPLESTISPGAGAMNSVTLGGKGTISVNNVVVGDKTGENGAMEMKGDSSVQSVNTALTEALDPNDPDYPALLLASRYNIKTLRQSVSLGLITPQEAQEVRRITNKKRQQAKAVIHAQRRKQILKTILEANKQLNKSEKADAKKFKDSHFNMYMLEAHHAIKKAVQKSFSMNSTDFQEISGIKYDIKHAVAAPGLIVDSAIMGLSVNVDTINIQDLPSTQLHPAGLNYFFIREPKKRNWEFNAKVCHPAFFTADFQRDNSRHSRIAHGLAKIYTRYRSEGEEYRNARNLKRVLAVPEYEKIPPKNQKNEKVRFLIDYKDPVKDDTVVARVTIQSIHVSELHSIHIVESNSPFVTLVCGSWRFTTEINALAGNLSIWDDLNWVFRLHHADKIQLLVYSGSSSNHVCVGTYEISSQDFLASPIDSQGYMKISAYLYEPTETTGMIKSALKSSLSQKSSKLSQKNAILTGLDNNGTTNAKTRSKMNQNDRAGKIELNVYVEMGNEWDWHVLQYKREQDRIYRKNQLKKKLSGTYTGPMERIEFPLSIKIVKMTLFDLKSVHMFKNNRPYVELSCGNSEFTTEVENNVVDSVVYDISWEFTLVSENANLIFVIRSERVTIGRYIINGASLIALQRNKSNYVEVSGDIMLGSEYTGKITLFVKLYLDNFNTSVTDIGSVQENYSDLASVQTSMSTLYNPTAPLNVTNMVNTGTNAAYNATLNTALLKTTNTSTHHITNPDNTALTTTNTNTNNMSKTVYGNVALPAMAEIHSIELAELVKVNKFKVNSPQCILTCGHYSNTTIPVPQAGSKAVWKKMQNWVFPVYDKCYIEIKVYSSYEYIGSMALRATELMTLPRDPQGKQTIYKDLHNGSDVCGKIRLVLSYTLEGRSYTVGKSIEKLARAVLQEPLISGYSSLPLGHTIASINESVNDNMTYKGVPGSVVLGDSREVEKDDYPLRMTVTDIIANDLRAAHVLVKNSPCVRMVSGTVHTTTSTIPSAGASAIWAGQECILFLQHHSSVRFSVFSKNVCIGFAVLEDSKILDSAPDLSGNRELYFTILNEDQKIAGKLKINFVLERVSNYVVPPAPFDSTQIRKGLEPPLLVIVHTISVINLRQVHRYGNNSPFVKLACDSYKTATSIVDYGGKNAKWVELGYEFVMYSNSSTIDLVVQSGTIVIGTLSVSADIIMSVNSNNKGMCEFTGQLVDSEGRTFEAGQIRLMYSYEAHIHDTDVHSDSSESIEDDNNLDNLYNTTLHNSISTTNSGVGKSIGHIHVLSIQCEDLYSVHTVSQNSPFCKLKCDDYRAATTTQYLAGRTATWTDLLISFSITRKSIITLTILSATTEIGTAHIPIKTLLTLAPNAEGHITSTYTVYQNDVNHGTVTLVLHIDRLNRFGFNESDIIPENVFHASDLDHVLRVNAADRTGDTNVLTPAGSKKRTIEGDSIDRDAKHFKTHNIAVSPITIPFVLRIVRVQCLDLAPDLRLQLHMSGEREVSSLSRVSAVLKIRLDNWSKLTPACATPLDTADRTHNTNNHATTNTTSLHPAVLAEWADPDWVFIITNPNGIFHFSLLSQHLTIGELTLSVGDCATCLPSRRGLVELVLYVFRGVVPCGKVRVCMSLNSYVSPEHMLSNNDILSHTTIEPVEKEPILTNPTSTSPITNNTTNPMQTQGNTLGVLRIKSISVNDLYQIYGLFPNSPKITIHFGNWSSSTSTAVDAGSDHTWEFTNWGRIPILENAVFTAKVTSGNETLGMFQISALEILALNGYKSEENVYVEGDIVDGMVVKGRFSMCVIPTLLNSAEYMMYNNIVDLENESVNRDGVFGPNNDSGVGAQKSWISDDSQGNADVRLDGETELNTLRNSVSLLPTSVMSAGISPSVSPNDNPGMNSTSQSTQPLPVLPPVPTDTHHSVLNQHPSLHDLSLSTPTPDLTLCSILGISIHNCKFVSSIFRNSPHVVISCDAFSNKTNTARFAGASANWILRKSQSWEISMRAATFLKISVFSNGTTLIGSVCVNTRELIVVPRDAQGLTVVIRDLEHNLEITGKVRLVMNLAFSMEKPEVTQKELAIPSLATNILGEPSVASFYPIYKKPSVSNSVIRTGNQRAVPDTAVNAVVSSNKFMLQLPINVHIVSVACTELSRSAINNANKLCVCVKHEDILHKSYDVYNTDSFVEWENLNYDIPILAKSVATGKNTADASSPLVFTIQSNILYVGEVSIPIAELLSAPRTSQGYTELVRTIKLLNTTVCKIQLCMLLSPYLTAEQKEQYTQQTQAELQQQLSTQPTIATLHIELISVIDVSPMYANLILDFSVGEFVKNDVKARNCNGNAVWGSLGWNDINLLERSNVVFTVSSRTSGAEVGTRSGFDDNSVTSVEIGAVAANNVVIGSFVVTSRDILNAPVDNNGYVVVYGDLVDGLVYKGKVSMMCRLVRAGDTSSSAVNTTTVKAAASQENNADTITTLTIQSIAAKSLKQVHKVGKNNPCVKIEYKGLKFQSNVIPYAGAKVEWPDLLWTFSHNDSALYTRNPGKLRITLTSGSAQIGSGTVAVSSILDKFSSKSIIESAEKDDKSESIKANGTDTYITCDLMKQGEFMGVLTLMIKCERTTTVDASVVNTTKLNDTSTIAGVAVQSILNIPANPYYSADATSVLSGMSLPVININTINDNVSVDDSIMTPTKQSGSHLYANIQEYQQHLSSDEAASLQSRFSLDSRSIGTSQLHSLQSSIQTGRSGYSDYSQSTYTDRSGYSDYTHSSGNSSYTDYTRDSSRYSTKISFSTLPPPRPLIGLNEVSTTSVTSTSVLNSSVGSRPKTSRTIADHVDSTGGSVSVNASLNISTTSISVASGDMVPTTQHSIRSYEDSQSLPSTFYNDSAHSSYVDRSNLSDHKNRTLHTLSNTNHLTKSSVGMGVKSGLNGSISVDSSTKFDSTVSHEDSHSSYEASIFSASNSLQSSIHYSADGSSVQSGSVFSHSVRSNSLGNIVDRSGHTPKLAWGLSQHSENGQSVTSAHSACSVSDPSVRGRDRFETISTLTGSVLSGELSQQPEPDALSLRSVHSSGNIDHTSHYTSASNDSHYDGSVDSRSLYDKTCVHSAYTGSIDASTGTGTGTGTGSSLFSVDSDTHTSRSDVSGSRSERNSGLSGIAIQPAWRQATNTNLNTNTNASSHSHNDASEYSARSTNSAYSDSPSTHAHSIYSNYTHHLDANQAEYGSYTSRSNSSYRSTSSYQSVLTDPTEYTNHTPRSKYSDYNSENRSEYSDYSEIGTPRTDYSEYANVGIVAARAGSGNTVNSTVNNDLNDDTLQNTYNNANLGSQALVRNNMLPPLHIRPGNVSSSHNVVNSTIGVAAITQVTSIIQPTVSFDVSQLHWLHPRAPYKTVVHFISTQFVGSVLNNVVCSFVAMQTNTDYNPSALNNSIYTYATTRHDIIQDAAFKLVRLVVKTAGTFVLQQQCGQFTSSSHHTVDPLAQQLVTTALPANNIPVLRNPYADANFKKRAGITLTGQNSLILAKPKDPNNPDSDSESEGGGGLRRKGEPEAPQKSRITFQDILGIDLGFIDRRIMPKRPYLTVCKPYGNWAAETPAFFKSLDNLAETDLILNWYDLHGKYKWEKFVLRLGQFLVFDLHDAGSGLIFAKGRLSYETIINKYMHTHTDIVSVFVEFTVANEYGGGKLGGVARVHVDISVNTFVRSKKAAEYWDQHRAEHWTAYPIVPISTGTVRQKYRDIAHEYDTQQLVHPAFFGFRTHFRGNPEDESRFIHPMFRGFTLCKKPTPKGLVSEITTKTTNKKAKPNPWRWDSNAHVLGKCLVCADGVPGCPRCFMYPAHRTGKSAGFPSTAEEFSFNPDLEREKARNKERAEIAAAAKRTRRMAKMKLDAVSGNFEAGSLGSLSAEHDSDEESESSNMSFYSGVHDAHTLSKRESYENAAEPTLTLHTNLTTYKALRDYRNLVQRLQTVYVKLIPTGYIKKFVVDSSDTLFNMYNMYRSHSSYGNCHSGMLLIPTIVGMFELHCQIETETDLLMAFLRGRDTLNDYNLNIRNSSIVMLFVPNYKREYVPHYLTTFFEKNTDFKLKHLPMYDTIEHLPRNIVGDVVQKYLLNLLTIDYKQQQTDMLREYVQRGLDYHQSRDAQLAIVIKSNNEQSQQIAKERLASKLRMESQLKGLTGPERKAAKKALKQRELNKKRSVLYEEEKAKLDQDNHKRVLNSRGQSRGGTGIGTGRRGLKRSNSARSRDSSNVSINDIDLDESTGSDSDSSSSSGDSSSSGSSDTSDSSDASDSSSSSSGSSSDDSIASAKRRKLRQSPGTPTFATADVPHLQVPLSARSTASNSSTTSVANKFIIVEETDHDEPDKESSVYTSYISKEGSLSARTGRSQLSSVTGLASSVTNTISQSSVGGSSLNDSGGWSPRSSNSDCSSSYHSRYSSEYSKYTPRSDTSGRTGSSYIASSYDSRSEFSSDYSSEYSSEYRSEYSSEYGSSAYSDSAYTSRTGDSYSTYYTDYSQDSANSVTSKPYHTGSSLHSMYSAASDPHSVKSLSRSVASLYSAIAAAPILDSGSAGDHTSVGNSIGDSVGYSGTRSGTGDYSEYTPRSESSSYYSPRSASETSASTGGLFTYRSNLSAGYTPRSEDSSVHSSVYGTAYSVSQDTASTYSYDSRTSGYSSRPSSANSAYSDGTYHSAISAVSDATYGMEGSNHHMQNDSYSSGRPPVHPPQPKHTFSDTHSLSTLNTLQSGVKSSYTQPTNPTLFSNDIASQSSYTSQSYVSSSASESEYTADGSESSSFYTQSSESRNTRDLPRAKIDDISIYSEEFTTSQESQDTSRSEDSSYSTTSSQPSLFSESSHTNTYHSVERYKDNQPPLAVSKFEPPTDSLRNRFEKLKKGREIVNSNSITVHNMHSYSQSGSVSANNSVSDASSIGATAVDASAGASVISNKDEMMPADTTNDDPNIITHRIYNQPAIPKSLAAMYAATHKHMPLNIPAKPALPAPVDISTIPVKYYADGTPIVKEKAATKTTKRAGRSGDDDGSVGGSVTDESSVQSHGTRQSNGTYSSASSRTSYDSRALASISRSIDYSSTQSAYTTERNRRKQLQEQKKQADQRRLLYDDASEVTMDSARLSVNSLDSQFSGDSASYGDSVYTHSTYGNSLGTNSLDNRSADLSAVSAITAASGVSIDSHSVSSGTGSVSYSTSTTQSSQSAGNSRFVQRRRELARAGSFESNSVGTELSDPLGSHILSQTASQYSRDGSFHSNSSNTVSGYDSEDVNSNFYAVSEDSYSPRDSRVNSGRTHNYSNSAEDNASRSHNHSRGDRGNGAYMYVNDDRGARAGAGAGQEGQDSIASSSAYSGVSGMSGVGFVSDTSYSHSDASSTFIAPNDAHHYGHADSHVGANNSYTDAGSAVSYGDSSSSGTVDYLYRSDVLSADDTANSINSEDLDF